VDVGNVAGVSQVQSASFVRVEASRVGEFSYICGFTSNRLEEKGGDWYTIRVSRDRGQEIFGPKSRYTNTHFNHFVSEDGGNMRLRNVGNSSHIHKMHIRKNRIVIGKDMVKT
jgi:hypothetical protein